MKRLRFFLFFFICLFGCGLTRIGRAEILFHETFDTLENWVQSSYQDDYGKVGLESGRLVGDPVKQQGLKLLERSKHYAISRKLPLPLKPRNKTLVVSLSIKHEGKIGCGGSYIKLLPEDFDQKTFSNSSTFLLMFGSDRCGNSSYMRIEKRYKGKVVPWRFKDPVPEDPFTHFYTLAFYSDNTYSLFVDGVYRWRSKIENDWKLLPPPLLDDPTDVKPDNWVDSAVMEDTNWMKPADWDDSQPALIRDPNSKAPPEYDEVLHGPWRAPWIRNPEFRGIWHTRKIPNPDYKGPWHPRRIPNPEYIPDPTLYQLEGPIGYVGIELWTVEGGTIFDDIMIADNDQEVLGYVRAHTRAYHEKEVALKRAEDERDKKFFDRHNQDMDEATEVYRVLEEGNKEDL